MSYLYLASPYTHHDPHVREARYLEALDALHWLLGNRIWTYSPIVHCHTLALQNDLPKDHDYWLEYNHLMILNSRGITVLASSGWEASKGVADEEVYATALNLPVSYMKKQGPNYVFSAFRTPSCTNA